MTVLRLAPDGSHRFRPEIFLWPALRSYLMVIEIEATQIDPTYGFVPADLEVVRIIGDAAGLRPLEEPAMLMVPTAMPLTPKTDRISVVVDGRVRLRAQGRETESFDADPEWRREVADQGQVLVIVLPGELDEETLNNAVTAGYVYGGLAPVLSE